MKIYTKTGDKGETSLWGGTKVYKDDLQIEAYGTIDELNCNIGNIINYTENQEIIAQLIHIQRVLFGIGAKLASDSDKGNIDIALEEEIKSLENQIDNWEEELSPLKSFILPSGSLSISAAHLARTVCRRAERKIVTLNRPKESYHLSLTYVNRLSDYLFVLSRKFAFDEDIMPFEL